METYLISNLDLSASGFDCFDFENINFRRLTNSGFRQSLIDQWHSDGVTYVVEIENRSKIQPIWNKNSNKALGYIRDLCLLLSIAQASYVVCPRYIIDSNEHVNTPCFCSRRNKVVADEHIITFLETAVQKCRYDSNWSEQTGFFPSAYFMIASTIKHPYYSEIFTLAWTALEILAHKHKINEEICSTNQFSKIRQSVHELIENTELFPEQKKLMKNKTEELNRPSIRSLIKKLRDDYSWQFLSNIVIAQSYECRNKLLHTGEMLPSGQVPPLEDYVQICLLHLLDCGKYIEPFITQKLRNWEIKNV